jgi:SpoVK/Ycf46/Vps4 family AAA+-type ATPase
VRPLRAVGCPLILTRRTQAQLDEVVHVLQGSRQAGVRSVFRGGPRRFFILLEGERSAVQRQAVHALRRAWGRPVYEIELSRVISKYIGEAEERLREIFELARQTGAGLFMDEAHDFLGARTEVKSSNDRYSAMQVNYVLQELDVFDGLLILATTRPAALDAAIRRRMLYQITFEPLQEGEREQLWRALVPPEAPVDPRLDWAEIAALYALDPDQIQKALFFAALAAARRDDVLRQEDVEEAAWELASG